MEIVSFEDFKKIDIRMGKIILAERIEGSDKLLKLQVDFGELDESNLPTSRQIVAGIAQFYAPEALIGKECPFAYNLAPRTMKGLESQGMLMCPSDSVGGPVLLHPDKDVTPGTIIK